MFSSRARLVVLCAGLASAARAQVTLTGRVIATATNRPLERVEVRMPFADRTTVTDSTGHFQLTDVPRGEHLLVIRAPGYRPDTSSVRLLGDAVSLGEVKLDVVVTPLAEVRVPGAPTPRVSPRLAGFEERKSMGLGHFLDRAFLDRNQYRQTGELLAQTVPGLIVQRGGSNAWATSGRLTNPTIPVRLDPSNRAAGAKPACFMDVYLDGVSVYTSGRSDPEPLFNLNSMRPDEVEGIEVYSGMQVPAEYSRTTGGCGVVLIWTRISK